MNEQTDTASSCLSNSLMGMGPGGVVVADPSSMAEGIRMNHLGPLPPPSPQSPQEPHPTEQICPTRAERGFLQPSSSPYFFHRASLPLISSHLFISSITSPFPSCHRICHPVHTVQCWSTYCHLFISSITNYKATYSSISSNEWV